MVHQSQLLVFMMGLGLGQQKEWGQKGSCQQASPTDD